MSCSDDDVHIVYLIEDDSGLPYIGITIERRMYTRRAGHIHSGRFSNGFTMTPIYSSKDRSHIEEMEEHFIDVYDSFENGKNSTKSGKGWGHNSPNFTTYGYMYSTESKKKMSESRKKAMREGRATRPICPRHILQEVGRKNKGRVRFNKVTEELATEIISTYLSSPDLGDGYITKQQAKDKSIFMRYRAAFLTVKAAEYKVRESSIQEILDYISYKTPENKNRNSKHSLNYEIAEKLREEYDSQVDLGVSFTTQLSWYSNYERAFSAAYADHFGVSNVTIYTIIANKKGKYDACWDKAKQKTNQNTGS